MVKDWLVHEGKQKNKKGVACLCLNVVNGFKKPKSQWVREVRRSHLEDWWNEGGGGRGGGRKRKGQGQWAGVVVVFSSIATAQIFLVRCKIILGLGMCLLSPCNFPVTATSEKGK